MGFDKLDFSLSLNHCNSLDPLSHAVIINDQNETNAINVFIYSNIGKWHSNNLFPFFIYLHFLAIHLKCSRSVRILFVAAIEAAQCWNNNRTNSISIWTSGRRMLPIRAYRFVWEPFPGKVKLFGGYSNWFPGEPNFHKNNESCLAIIRNSRWNDDNCWSEKCVLCEVDILDWLICFIWTNSTNLENSMSWEKEVCGLFCPVLCQR